ncbi:MAG TPA: alpha/beta fold hydrolase [Rubricoccaceae bacterium]
MTVDLPPYRPPRALRGGHRQTVGPSLFRRVTGVDYRRETVELLDGDALDLDRVEAPGSDRRVALVAHGLEGSADRAYVRGMVRALVGRGWDAVAWNLRGCGGTPNRLLRAYHSGATEDLDAVVRHVLAEHVDGQPRYAAVGLVGFSLGGNLTLKYLGDAGDSVDPRVVGAACFSVPVDLAGSAAVMERPTRRVYMARFMRSLAAKAEEKAARFADAPSPDGLRRMRTFREFDGHFTAPVHGYASADDYWARASALPVLGQIRVPTLLVNALDDPFLSPSCYPTGVGNPDLTVLTPPYGGHVGFVARGEYWSETVAGIWLDAAHTQAARAQAA